jgi:hypothetical protein
MSPGFISPKNLLIVLCVFLLISTVASASDTWTRKNITINTSSALPAGYQVNLNISYNSNMSSSFSDLRFRDSNNYDLPYWIESYNSTQASIWVKLKDGVNVNTSIVISMYYGNPTVIPATNGNNTFEVFGFDGFTEVDPSSQLTVTSSKVTVASQTTESSNVYKTINNLTDFSTSFEINVSTMNGDSATDIFLLGDATTNVGWATWGSNNGISVNVQSSSGNKYIGIYKWVNGARSNSAQFAYSANTPYYLTFSRNSTTATLSVFTNAARTVHLSGSPVTLSVVNTSWNKLNIANNMITYSGARSYYIQNMFVRKVVTTEPTTSISSTSESTSFTLQRTPITINTSSSLPSAYQVKLLLSLQPNMSSNFDDIRFRDSNNYDLPYYIESINNTPSPSVASIWVKLKDNVSANSSVNISMYYGNPVITSASNGVNTFEFFDDFEGARKMTWTNYVGTWVNEDGYRKQTSTASNYKASYVTTTLTDYIVHVKVKSIGALGTYGAEGAVQIVLIQHLLKAV